MTDAALSNWLTRPARALTLCAIASIILLCQAGCASTLPPTDGAVASVTVTVAVGGLHDEAATAVASPTSLSTVPAVTTTPTSTEAVAPTPVAEVRFDPALSLVAGSYILRVQPVSLSSQAVYAINTSSGIAQQISGSIRLIDSVGSLAWSMNYPDRLIAVVRGEIAVVSISTAQLVTLESPSECGPISAAHQRPELAAICIDPDTGRFQLYVVDLETLSVTEIAVSDTQDQEFRGIDWAPNDARIILPEYWVFEQGRSRGILVIDSDCIFAGVDCMPESLFQPKAGELFDGPIAWSPSGNQLAVYQSPIINIRNALGGVVSTLVVDDDFQGSITWAPDETHLAIDYGDSRGLFVADIESHGLRLLSEGEGSSVAWIDVP